MVKSFEFERFKELRTKSGRFKPRKLTKKDQQELHKLGFDKTRSFDVQPVFEEKSVTTSGCQVCEYNFTTSAIPVSVCFKCGNCVFCGAYNEDKMSNYCFTCGNGGPRFDSVL